MHEHEFIRLKMEKRCRGSHVAHRDQVTTNTFEKKCLLGVIISHAVGNPVGTITIARSDNIVLRVFIHHITFPVLTSCRSPYSHHEASFHVRT